MIVHILWYEDIKFLPGIVGEVNDDPDLFDRDNQLFVVAHESMYKAVDAPNVILDTSFNDKNTCARLINKYAPKADGIILHMLCDPIELLLVKPWHLKKILWKMWGCDTVFYHFPNGESVVKDFFKRRLEEEWKRRIRSFRALCGDSVSDFIVLRELAGEDARIIKYSYANPKTTDLPIFDDDTVEDCGLDIDADALNILLGHSGFPEDSHIEILKKLEKYHDENIRVWIGFGYGDPEYMPEVEAYVAENWSDKATILTDMMPFNKYNDFLNRMDVAILNGKLSYALGNIYHLIKKKKKLIVNKDGIIRKAFDLDHVPYRTTDTAFDVSFEEFAAPLAYGEDSGRMMRVDRREILEGLYELFETARGA